MILSYAYSLAYADFYHSLHLDVGSSLIRKKWCLSALTMLAHAGMKVRHSLACYPVSGPPIASLWVRLLVCYGITGYGSIGKKGHDKSSENIYIYMPACPKSSYILALQVDERSV